MDKHYGTCHGPKCKKRENVLIAYRWTSRDQALCVPCNYERLKARKARKSTDSPLRYEIVSHAGLKRVPISKTPTPRLEEKRDQDWVVGRKIWDERKHECVECGKFLPDPLLKYYLSHVLSKGAHPEDHMRFDPENIVLHCKRCHDKWETAGEEKRGMKTYLLKRSYMEQHVPLKD